MIVFSAMLGACGGSGGSPPEGGSSGTDGVGGTGSATGTTATTEEGTAGSATGTTGVTGTTGTTGTTEEGTVGSATGTTGTTGTPTTGSSTTGGSSEPGDHPRILLDADELAAIQAKVAAQEEPWKSAYDQMIEQANAALTLPDMSVTFGGANACDAPATVFCTGKFYDDEADSYDFDNGARPIGQGVRDLGMAYAFTGDLQYGDKLAQLVRVWALDPGTGMQPGFSNNQSRISLFSTMPGLIYGVDLAWSYPGWTEAERDALHAWVQTFGENAMAFSPVENNFENWRNAFLSVAGAFTGDPVLLDAAFQNFRDAIPDQVASGQYAGRLTQEYSRTAGWGGIGYSLFAAHAMTMTAEVARHHGVDLYNYTSDGSKGLRLVLDFHAPYLLDPTPGGAGTPFSAGEIPLDASHGIGIYEVAYSFWEEQAYLDVVEFWGRPMGMNIWAFGVVTLTHANRFDLDLGG